MVIDHRAYNIYGVRYLSPVVNDAGHGLTAPVTDVLVSPKGWCISAWAMR